ncbi:E3 ubiquitin-protein ligase DRIP [Marchantia polymorpha subsp. ruderalis]|uniref:Ubiquitin-like domain-containing protein n=1 Tax=Marchantia polymorpha subsp. ruderalis TaxID=1480154 RepID=A0AAF6BQB8_MARPO|nr:hypothetical protein Mp_6g09730 [Marchantia polymorpha subsp. ruderalis]
MKHAVHNIITPACRTNGVPERHVARATQARFVDAGAGPAAVAAAAAGGGGGGGFRDIFGTDESLTGANRSRSEVHLAPWITKRKYEDMTSSRVDEVEAENDHELSSKLSFFRENKRRKPPEAGDLMLMQVHVKVQDQSEDECQVRTRGSSPRSGSTSRVVITPEACGESDLTAETLMAEESSRSSNNDGSSKFESAAESVSKGSTREPRSGSSLRVLHSFLDQPEGHGEVRIPFSDTLASPAQAHQSRQQQQQQQQAAPARKDDHISLSYGGHMESMNQPGTEGVAKLEPASFRSLASSEQQSSAAAAPAWGSNKTEQWLQLGVGSTSGSGSSRNTPPSNRLNPGAEHRRESPPFQQANADRPHGKRKNPSLDFQISESRDAESLSENTNMAAAIQWQAQRGPMPRKFEPNIDSASTLTPPPAYVSLPASSFSRTTTGVAEMGGPNYNLEKDLCLFGNLVTAPSPQLVLAPGAPGPLARDLAGNASERNLGTMSSLLAGSLDPRHPAADPHGGKYPMGAENLLLGGGAGGAKAGIFSRAVPFLPRSGEDVQFKSPQHSATDHSQQFQRGNRQSALAALMQSSEDQRQAAGHAWLSPSDSAQKLIPLANNFQGWSSDMSTSSVTRSGTGSDQAAVERHPNQVDLQLQRASDEWGNLFKRVSPNMLFPSQVQLPDGSSRMLNLDKNAAAAAASQEALDHMDAFKRAIKIQNRPQSQWNTPEPTSLGAVANWCLNGGKPLPGPRAEKLEAYSGERAGMSPMLPDRLPVQGRYQDIEQILSTKQASQRQSWQPAAGQPKLQHGNVNILRGSRSAAPSVSKPRFQVLPPVSRGTSQAGLWFILQSAAENQNDEAGLPQITKAYLRIKDGKMPVSAVKKYLATKLGLASEAEVEITCRGQPVVPNLPLQHVRDVIWYSNLNPSKDQTTTTTGSGDRDESTSADQRVRPAANCNPAMFSKDVVMVLTYRRHPRTMPPQHC